MGAVWQEVRGGDGILQRVANVDLKKDEALEQPIHFVCVKSQNHQFMLGSINVMDRFGRLTQGGRRGRVCKFFNGHFIAKTKAEADYCRSKPSWIFEEPEDGPVYEVFDGNGRVEFSTRNSDVNREYQAKNRS